jgi:hypothetical protein
VVAALADRVASSLFRLKNDVRGLRILTQWLGDGGVPVPRKLAEYRASICATCPKNQTGYKLEKSVAEAIIEQEEVRHNMSLTLPDETKLETCDA